MARIARVIQIPYGNALLVGVGGSGRKSLTALAASMCELKLFQIELTKTYGMVDWRDDLKKLFQQAGGAEATSTVFMFSDSQIKTDGFVEDINNILNSGEVPNLFAPDERQIIIDTLEPQAAKAGLGAVIKGEPTAAEVFAWFVERCRTNLHIVLCFSPIGSDFRTRLRMFPSLVNCCLIDWFTPWPNEALRSVAGKFLADVALVNSLPRGCGAHWTECGHGAIRLGGCLVHLVRLPSTTS